MLTRRRFLGAAAALGSGAFFGANGCHSRSGSGSRIRAGSGLSKLRASLDGALILPSDDAFEGARRTASFNPRSDKRPAVIVRCATSSDVARSVEYARKSNLEVAVRSGGHDVLSSSVCDAGVLIDVEPMSAIRVAEDRRTAWVQAGSRAGQVNNALGRFGVAAALGCNPAVGVAGLTLGGGLGWLLGRYGASCDNVTAVELVTADGRQLRATAEEHAELFWALRGGGGNFGIATDFELRLHPVEKVMIGCFVYRARHAVDVLRVYRQVMATAPDELTVEVMAFASAEAPAHPPVLVLAACFCGGMGDAVRALAPLRAVGPPEVEVVRELPYAGLDDPLPELAPIFGLAPSAGAERPPEPSGGFNYWQGASTSSWTDEAIDAFVARAASAPPGWSMGLGHYMHGALCRVDERDSPLIRRQGRSSYFFNIGWGTPDRAFAAMAWVDASMATMKAFSDTETYVNYLSSDSETEVASSYGANYRRLQAVKRALDPDNVLHLNRNIRPAAAI